MIKPTVGRVVWYHPGRNDDFVDVCAAVIAHVWNDTCVNLMVIDPNGNSIGRTSVYLLQDGDEAPAQYAEWMPYQKGQAAKTEELEKKLASSE